MLNTPVFECDKIPAVSPSKDDESDGTKHCTYFDPIPVQAYFIDEYGLNRIVGRGLSKEYYQHQFSAGTDFAGRPYYKPAVNKAQEALTEANGRIDSYFYATDPYFDAAGNGLVVTLARGFSYPSLGRGALCFDLAMKKPLLPLDTLDQIGAIARIAHCIIPFSDLAKPKCTLDASGHENPPSVSRIDPEVQSALDENHSSFRRIDPEVQSSLKLELETKITILRGEHSLSDITGALQILGHWKASSESDVGRGWIASFAESLLEMVPYTEVLRLPAGSWQLLVSAPLGPPTNVTDTEEDADLLVFNVNVPAFRRQTLLWGIGALSTLLFALAVMLSVWEVDSRTSREMYEALKRVSKVMSHSGLAFTWLNSDDRIVEASDEFLKCLGYRSLDELFQDHPDKTFKSLISKKDKEAYEKDKTTYEGVEQNRKQGKPVRPYPINFENQGRQI